MKCGVRISKSELGDMFFYVIVNLISVIACEFAFASRKTMGITCVKDFVITYGNAGYYVTVNIIFQENV